MTIGDYMPKGNAQQRENEVLLRMLKTSPKPHAPLNQKRKPSRKKKALPKQK
jgi:hypothetical protein